MSTNEVDPRNLRAEGNHFCSSDSDHETQYNQRLSPSKFTEASPCKYISNSQRASQGNWGAYLRDRNSKPLVGYRHLQPSIPHLPPHHQTHELRGCSFNLIRLNMSQNNNIGAVHQPYNASHNPQGPPLQPQPLGTRLNLE